MVWLFFWIPWEFEMLGRSESTLRQGFRRRRKRLYGAKAPRPGRGVGQRPVHDSKAEDIDFNCPFQKERHLLKADVFLFGFRRPEGR